MHIRKTGIIALLVLALTLVSACASFENKQLARIDKLPDVSTFKNKPSVYIDLSCYLGKPNKNSTPKSRSNKPFLKIINRVLEKADLFSKYSFNESEKTEYDYTLKIKIYNSASPTVGEAAGLILLLTSGLITIPVTDYFVLELQAIDNNGITLGNYSNSDSVTTWFGLLFIPMMGYTIPKAGNNTIENQFTSALKELIDSGVMQYSY